MHDVVVMHDVAVMHDVEAVKKTKVTDNLMQWQRRDAFYNPDEL
jgi:hypothetical protein